MASHCAGYPHCLGGIFEKTGVRNELKKIRLLLAASPASERRFWRKIFAGAPDLKVVGEIGSREPLEILLAIRERDPALVILMAPGSRDPGVCSHIVDQFPEVAVLVIAGDKDRASLLKRKLTRIPLPDTAPSTILSAIREGAAGESDPQLR